MARGLLFKAHAFMILDEHKILGLQTLALNFGYLQHLFTWHEAQISSRYVIVDIGSNIA
jgi:hypothetical protein